MMLLFLLLLLSAPTQEVVVHHGRQSRVRKVDGAAMMAAWVFVEPRRGVKHGGVVAVLAATAAGAAAPRGAAARTHAAACAARDGCRGGRALGTAVETGRGRRVKHSPGDHRGREVDVAVLLLPRLLRQRSAVLIIFRLPKL